MGRQRACGTDPRLSAHADARPHARLPAGGTVRQLPSAACARPVGGSQITVGVDWSDTLETCTGSAGSDGIPAIPRTGLTVHRADRLTISVGGGMTLFEVSSARYAAAVGTVAPSDQQDLSIQAGPTPGTYYVDTPPVGAWVVLLTVAVNDVAHGVVWSQGVDFRVTVTP